MKQGRTKQMILCGMFVALTAAGALIRIPIPVVPFTLQFLFTTLAGLLLGGRLGGMAVCIYICLGLAGLPIFAQGEDQAICSSPASATSGALLPGPL